ncbi:hypothetical protein RND81_01G103800 [Saponaria officinalis]|uniref:Neprosin PEP catalytic domain-containing protein n=1 Tax=Saponaria officinalis TaxID=3572 RepID=A0AAW1N6V3_SAPOF
MDNTTKHWWLTLNEEQVGYWPSSLVPRLNNGASFVTWGGEVFTSATSRHPPSMGSGWRPETGYGSASFIAKVHYVNKGYQVVDAGRNLERVVTDPALYDVSEIQHDANLGTHLYYGGA